MKNTNEITTLAQLQNDLIGIQSLAKIGFWRLDLNKQKLHWTDEVYKIFDMVKRKDRPLEIKDFLNAIYTYDGLPYIEQYNKHLEEKEPFHVVHRIVTRDKQIKWIEERCETEFDNSGEPIVSIGTIQDITVAKENELLLKQQQDYMYQQQRFAQIGEMLSMIAHQWRTPISHIGTTALMAQMKLELNKFDFTNKSALKECKEFTLEKLQDISTYVTNMSQTIDEFGEFYKHENVTCVVPFVDIIQKAIQMIMPLIHSEAITIKTLFQSDKMVNVNQNEISQVIINLIKNSVDNFKRKEIQKRIIEIELLEVDEFLKVIIKDNGGGIEKKHMNKVFDPYFSQKYEKNGKGLGLYMSKIIVENYHEGELNISNGFEGIICELVLRKDIETS